MFANSLGGPTKTSLTSSEVPSTKTHFAFKSEMGSLSLAYTSPVSGVDRLHAHDREALWPEAT